MTDILLINPFSWTRDGRPPYLPYGILYLAGYLRHKGFLVSVFDCNTSRHDPMDAVDRCKPRMVGMTVMTGPVIREALDLSKRIRKDHPGIKIVWGGHHPTLFPDHCLEYCDYIIRGEGERALYELLENERHLENIDGLGFWSKEGNHHLNPMPLMTINLDHLPMPAWDLVNVGDYIARRSWAKRVLTLNTSRGCVNKCAFCVNQSEMHHRFRAMGASRVYQQMIYLKMHYGVDGIHFLEDSFDISKPRVRGLCALIAENALDIKWSHFGTIPGFDPEIVRIEKAAGLRQVEFGVESGSDKILKVINKRQTAQGIRDVFRSCKSIGVTTSATFMIGLPTETESELNETVKLINRLPARQPVCSIYRPYPGTPLYKWLINNDKFEEPDTLEDQADYYAYGELNQDIPNVSDVPTKKLIRIQKYYLYRIALQELWYCIKTFDIESILYYCKIFINRLRMT